MSAIFVLLLCLLVGPGFLAYGIWILRSRAWRESVPLAELVIDRVLGANPPPRNQWDRRFALGQAWFLTIFGGLVTLGLVTILILKFVTE